MVLGIVDDGVHVFALKFPDLSVHRSADFVGGKEILFDD